MFQNCHLAISNSTESFFGHPYKSQNFKFKIQQKLKKICRNMFRRSQDFVIHDISPLIC